MEDRTKLQDRMNATVETTKRLGDTFEPRGHVKASAYDPEGNLKWEDEGQNLVTNEGEAYYLDVGVANGTQVTAWNVGLFGSVTAQTGTLAEGDVLSSFTGTGKGGIVFFTSYSEANRPAFTEGSVVTGATPSVHNTATPASFSITGTGTLTVGGAFLASTNTKGGSGGQLLAERAFGAGDRTLQSGDTLKIEYTLTAGGS